MVMLYANTGVLLEKKSLLVFDVPNWVFTTFRNTH